jgi:hypothetical protein
MYPDEAEQEVTKPTSLLPRAGGEPTSLPWTRSNRTREENGVGIDFTLGGDEDCAGGSMSLEDLMTYTSITSLTWSYVKACGRGHTRVLYGYRNDAW